MLEIRNNNLKSRAINRVEPTRTRPNQPERKGVEPIIILDQAEFGPRFETRLKYEWRLGLHRLNPIKIRPIIIYIYTCMHIYIYATTNVLLLNM
mgnify:CR=1 FL=1